MNSDEILALAETSNSEHPCGINLEYSAEFFSLEALVQGTPEQQFGDTIIPAIEPDWIKARQQCVSLIQQSKDLRLVTVFTRSLIATEGLDLLLPSLGLIEQLLTKYWWHLHPELEDGDSTFRLNALGAINDNDFLLRQLRLTPVLPLRGHDVIRIIDIEQLHTAHQHSKLQLGELQQHIQAQPDAARALSRTLNDCIACCQRIDDILENHVSTHSSVTENLQQLLRVVLHHLPSEAPTPVASNQQIDATQAQTIIAESTIRAASGQIQSRADIVQQIDQMCDYLAKHEPSNPAPLLLRRAQKILSMDFLQLMNELNPDGVSQIEHLAGLNR